MQRTYLALMGLALGAGLIQLAGPLLARTMPSRAPLNQAGQRAFKPRPVVSPAAGAVGGMTSASQPSGPIEGLPSLPPPPPLVSSSSTTNLSSRSNGSGTSQPGQVVALEVVPFKE